MTALLTLLLVAADPNPYRVAAANPYDVKPLPLREASNPFRLTDAAPPAAPPKFKAQFVVYDHHEGRDRAVKDNAFLVLWVREDPAPLLPPGPVDGAVNARAAPFDGYADGDVLISGPWPGMDERHQFAHLRGADHDRVTKVLAHVRELYAAAAKEVQAQRATPFDSRPRPATVEDSPLARGPWPEDVDFPADMERYEPAKITQLVASTTFPSEGHHGDFQRPVLRRGSLEEKYNVNGGMVGIRNVRSDVYRNATAKGVKQWKALITVNNSAGYTQPVTAWKMEFPEESKFMDVLSLDGKVFEIREREKFNGRWRYHVTYEDPEARPKGYTGKLTQSCVSCHKNAGGANVEDANYNGGLPPGGDQTFSVPIYAMEGRR